MRTVFKSASDADTVKKEIETAERDVENLQVLLDIVTIHQGKDVIPRFKRQKQRIYKSLLATFSVAEINNAHSIASFWNKIAENKHVMQEIMTGNPQKK